MQEMKYFNEGNDCDICKNQLMTGRDGTVEDCRRRQNGLSCRFEERDIRTCPVCEHEVDREDMYFTTRQDRTPAQVIDRGDGRYRYLTERECWRLMGYSDEDFDRAKAVQERNGKYYKALYDQAGNSIAVPIFESIFRKIILQEVA